MKKETTKKAVEIINRSMKYYQRRLTEQLEIRAETELKNGNLKNASLGNYEEKIQKYETILADLATIKRAIRKNKTSVKILGTKKNRNTIYIETSREIKKAGFEYSKNMLTGEIDFWTIEES